ncbi:MAG: hypothetical protein DMG26_18560 [Acidobacteria bacterium]|nr:MAG: hypothetical protein DMG26_18560 [Acidobacteriota bacterium]
MRVGVHTSIAGGVENAAHHAKEIGCDTFQMFSANPRGWKTLDPPPAACERFREAVARYGQSPVIVHDNYLINLAAADLSIRKKSIAAFRREIARAVALGADYLVTHPGSAKATTTSKALATCVDSLRQAARGLPLNGLTILIENTAGQGMAIGRTFEEVTEIISGAAQDLPVGACIDTAHCFAAGYLAETLKQLDSTVGLEKVRVIHANDSKTAFVALGPSPAHRPRPHRRGSLCADRAATEARQDPVHLRDADRPAGGRQAEPAPGTALGGSTALRVEGHGQACRMKSCVRNANDRLQHR